MVWPVSRVAACISFARAALCLSTRLTTEFLNAGHTLKLPQSFINYAKNKGASFYTSASILGAATLYALTNIDWQNVSAAALHAPASLSMFVLSGLSYGKAVSLGTDHRSSIYYNLGGTVVGAVGTFFAGGPNQELVLAAPFTLAVVQSLRESFNGVKNTDLWMRPDLLMAAGALGNACNAYIHKDYIYATTNLSYVFGFIALDRTKNHGGMASWVNNTYCNAPKTPATAELEHS